MLLKFRSPFKLEDQKENHHNQMNRSKLCKETKYGSHERAVVKRSNNNPVGLRILVQISSSQGESNYVVVKSSLRSSSQPTTSSSRSSTLDSCFLKTCNLCNKGLSLDKEVYMYRGDQGFCSIECRDRQIYLDEIKELEASTKKMIASYRNSSNCIISPSRNEPQRHKSVSNHQYRRNRPLVIS